MNFSENKAESFRKQLVRYMDLKQEQEIAELLRHSKLRCTWYTHDNWDGGFDIYDLDLEVPMNIYVKLDDRLGGLGNKICSAANHLMRGRDEIATVSFAIQESSHNQTTYHENINEKLSKLNSKSIHQRWSKAIGRLNGDPDGAITAASTLLEETIKSILNALAIEYSDEKDKLPKLYSLLANKLNLSPSQHTEGIFKHILGGCHSIVQGLGSLRNKVGDAHAQVKRPVKPALRHAELSVNLAGAMAIFLIATWENSKVKDQKNKSKTS